MNTNLKLTESISSVFICVSGGKIKDFVKQNNLILYLFKHVENTEKIYKIKILS